MYAVMCAFECLFFRIILNFHLFGMMAKNLTGEHLDTWQLKSLVLNTYQILEKPPKTISCLLLQNNST
jgi:hypothetical protein